MKSIKKDIAILVLYQRLDNDGGFSFDFLKNITDCSKRTCSRYLSDIRLFLKEYEKKHELVYCNKTKEYVLVKISD